MRQLDYPPLAVVWTESSHVVGFLDAELSAAAVKGGDINKLNEPTQHVEEAG